MAYLDGKPKLAPHAVPAMSWWRNLSDKERFEIRNKLNYKDVVGITYYWLQNIKSKEQK